MPNFELYPRPVVEPSSNALNEIEAAGTDRKEITNILVRETKRIRRLTKKTFGKAIDLDLQDYSNNPLTDLSGWVLFIRQLSTDDPDDPYFADVARIEISELEANGGKPIVKVKEWFEANGDKGYNPFGISSSVPPSDVVLYLQSILATGNARPMIRDDLGE